MSVLEYRTSVFLWKGGESLRGKLRDKRALKRDNSKRESMDRRQTTKRDNRLTVWINSDEEDQIDDVLLDEEEAQEDIPVIEIPGVKILK